MNARPVAPRWAALLTAGSPVRVPLRAADFPARPMNWIVPFPPGGSNDIFARPIAAYVGQRLGEPVVVENRGGAGGTVGGMIARARQARRLHLAGRSIPA